jgi:hypothetical protein
LSNSCAAVAAGLILAAVVMGPSRILLFGASNVRRGLPTAVETARAAWGPDIEIFGAFGHGRSYGKRSCIPFRCLPGILECGIWSALEDAPRDATAAVIADVGNDILYGESPETIVGWVSECADRLSTTELAIVGLPLPGLRALGPAAFLLFRSILFPRSRLSLRRALSAVEEVDEGLRRLAEREGARFVEPDPAWYGTDPIHIRGTAAESAWARILGARRSPPRLSMLESGRLRLAAPERRWICGIERTRAQPALVRGDGTRIFLY